MGKGRKPPPDDFVSEEEAELARSFTPMIIIKLQKLMSSDADPALKAEALEQLERALRHVDAGRQN